MDDIFDPKPRINYYEVLGCDQSSSIEQIKVEYKQRALECHPDKNSEPENLPKFQLLQEAKTVLTNSDQRISYDKWLNAGIQVPFHKWLSLQGQTSMHWVKKQPTKPSINSNVSNETKPVWESELPNKTLLKFRNYDI